MHQCLAAVCVCGLATGFWSMSFSLRTSQERYMLNFGVSTLWFIFLPWVITSGGWVRWVAKVWVISIVCQREDVIYYRNEQPNVSCAVAVRQSEFFSLPSPLQLSCALTSLIQVHRSHKHWLYGHSFVKYELCYSLHLIPVTALTTFSKIQDTLIIFCFRWGTAPETCSNVFKQTHAHQCSFFLGVDVLQEPSR